jgi:hypothetical protein
MFPFLAFFFLIKCISSVQEYNSLEEQETRVMTSIKQVVAESRQDSSF